MARRIFIAGNWKMNMGPGDGEALARALKTALVDCQAVDLLVAPPYLAVPEVVSRLQSTDIQVAAQNLHWEKTGAYTGEVSAEMIRDAGCQQVLIGHSERRQYFGETESTVNRKVHAALRAGLKIIFCFGETLEQRDAGQEVAVVEAQLDGGLAGVQDHQMDSITLAYEPVWAIGTGRTATPEQAQQIHADIRAWLVRRFSDGLAAGTRILYGGSVKPANAFMLLSSPDIDGALVGGASLDAPTFAGIAEAGCRVKTA